MPRFHWKGRSADGREIEGDIDAASKEDVLGRLRGQRILVTTVTAKGGDGPLEAGLPAPPAFDPRFASPPPSAAGLGDRMARERAAGRPRRLRGILIMVAFVLGAFVVGLAAPIVTYRCERADGEALSCSITERDLGVVPLREQKLSGVNFVGYETRWIDGRDERGAPTKTSSRRLLFRNKSGASVTPSYWDQDGGGRNGLGASSSSVESAVGNLLRGDITGPVSLWQAQWLPLLLSGLLLLLGLLMLALTILSLFVAPTEAAYAAAGSLARSADAQRRRQGH